MEGEKIFKTLKEKFCLNDNECLRMMKGLKSWRTHWKD